MPADAAQTRKVLSESTKSCSAEGASENKQSRSGSKRPIERILTYRQIDRAQFRTQAAKHSQSEKRAARGLN